MKERVKSGSVEYLGKFKDAEAQLQVKLQGLMIDANESLKKLEKKDFISSQGAGVIGKKDEEDFQLTKKLELIKKLERHFKLIFSC